MSHCYENKPLLSKVCPDCKSQLQLREGELPKDQDARTSGRCQVQRGVLSFNRPRCPSVARIGPIESRQRGDTKQLEWNAAWWRKAVQLEP